MQTPVDQTHANLPLTYVVPFKYIPLRCSIFSHHYIYTSTNVSLFTYNTKETKKVMMYSVYLAQHDNSQQDSIN